jgi:hypothetical protein
MDSHPTWCGAHPKINFNEDFCQSCDSEVSPECFDDHLESVVHIRNVDFPSDWFGYDNFNWNLWLRQSSSEKKPRLFAAMDSMNENDAVEVSKEVLEAVIKDLSGLFKAM